MTLKKIIGILMKHPIKSIYEACRDGDLDIGRLNDNNLNYGLIGACEGGHFELVKLIMSKGATDFNGGLRYACQGGHLDLVNLMISKGANAWNFGLQGACQAGNLEIADLMISLGADQLNWGFSNYNEKNKMELCKLVISRGAIYRYLHIDFNYQLFKKSFEKRVVCSLLFKFLCGDIVNLIIKV